MDERREVRRDGMTTVSRTLVVLGAVVTVGGLVLVALPGPGLPVVFLGVFLVVAGGAVKWLF